ncbi:MAG: hypothetical protein M3463_02690 [Verrucomicrobiota bacterium]|nr:hypothetical protein [Verrucomicrobiota bacterium]
MNAFLLSNVQQWRTVQFLRWSFRAIFNWRTARRAMLALATLATLIAIFYAVENWRGQRAWAQLKQEMEARGEKLDVAAFIPPPVPDERNFAMAPLWRDIFANPNTAANSATRRPHVVGQNGRAKVPQRGDWLQARRTDLADWQRYYRELHAEMASFPNQPVADEFPIPPEPGTPAEDVLLALSRFDQKLEEMRAAARRPESRFPLRYEDGFNTALPHLGLLQGASAVLKLRSLAELELGQIDAAFADVQLHFRMLAALKTEPLLISQLVRMSLSQAILEPIWHGAADHRWTDAQLAALEDELQKFDFLADFDSGRQFERAFGLQVLGHLQATRDAKIFSLLTTTGTQLRNPEIWAEVYRAMPGGWFAQNRISYVGFFRQLGSPRASPSAQHIASQDWRRRCQEFLHKVSHVGPYSFLASPGSTWIPEIATKFIRTEALARLAWTACALERYRLAHGRYPQSLAPLAPQFIAAVPRDVIDGGELKYRRTNDDRFVLYSIGWNGKDDGGEVVLNRDRVDEKEGDWVWKYPPE